jgi:hypothetical protein
MTRNGQQTSRIEGLIEEVEKPSTPAQRNPAGARACRDRSRSGLPSVGYHLKKLGLEFVILTQTRG